MSEQDKRISAFRAIDASAKDIFAVLSDPARHPEIDASGMVRSLDRGEPIEANGATFMMNMHNERRGDYQMVSTVVGFVPNKLIAWEPAPPETSAYGWQWVWELDSTGSDSTDVTLSYDWSRVTDKEVLKRVSFPPFSEDDLEGSLAKMAAVLSAV